MSESNVLKIDVKNWAWNQDPFQISVDGVSDVSVVATDLIGGIGNVILNRLVSISSFVGAQKITDLINIILEQIPDEIPLPGTDFYIQGGVSNDFEIKKDAYIRIPSDILFQNKKAPDYGENLADFSTAGSRDPEYEMQFYTSEALLQSVIQAIYYWNNLALPAIPLNDYAKGLLYW